MNQTIIGAGVISVFLFAGFVATNSTILMGLSLISIGIFMGLTVGDFMNNPQEYEDMYNG